MMGFWSNWNGSSPAIWIPSEKKHGISLNSMQSMLVMGLGMGLDRYVCIWENLHLPEFASSLLVLGKEFKTK